MKPFVYRFVFVLFFCAISHFGIYAATALGLGDIAFTGYNSDASATDGDDFSFVLLKDVDAGTTITFTDRGWFSSGGFRTATEGILTITLPASSCGDEFRVINNPSTSTSWNLYGDAGTNIGNFISSGTGSGFILDSTGDQLFAYQGGAPTSGSQTGFISAMQTHGNWDADASDSFTSALPSIFSSNPGNDVAFGVRTDQDNGKYNCSITSGLATAIKAAVYNASNWSFSNTSGARFNLLSYCNFTCTAACTDPSISSLTTNSTIGSNTFCPGDNVIITINGTKGDATTWNLYSGSCGGTIEDATPAVDGSTTVTIPSITATATYYVGGVGGCVASPTCTSILITVNGLAANAGSDQKISGSTTANISGNGSGTWSIVGVGDGNGYFDGAPGTTTSTTASTTFNGTAGQQYELRWTVTNAGCTSSSDDVVITFLSQTTLGLGDIAFTGYHSDTPDEFRFVLLKDINAGTQITFTDNGWLSAGGFRGGENTIVYEFCRPYACGDEFVGTPGNALQDEGTNEAAPIISGTFPALAVSGDQLFAYQGTAPTTGGASNWIAAIQMNGAWDANAVDAATSARPSAFTDGVNSISIAPHVDNAKYNCSITTNSPANLRTAVNTASNWTTQNASLALDFCSFTCGSCVEPVLTASDVSAPATACPGQTVAISITGTLNGANEWAIYTGSCGGSFVGATSTSSFNVTPTATTTYYISGRGGCVVTETCQTVTISVTSVQANAGPDQKLNGGSFTTLQANGGFGDGTWTFVDAGDGQGSFSDDENPSATFSGTPGQSYTLKWTINNPDPCPDTEDEVTIVFLDQTGLTLGDIAFISYSADEDDFAFVILKDINAGTTIKFTDQGWKSGGGFRGNEGTIIVEFCRPYACGTEFNVFDAPHEIKDADGQVAGTVSGAALQPSTSGDQIFAYQGNEPTAGNEGAFIAAIHWNGAWDADATDGATSAQPSVFTDGSNSISFGTVVQNGYIDCSKVTVASATQINDASNWITSNSTPASLPLNCNLNCCTPGVASSISGSPGPLCPSSTQTLTVNGSLNDDQTWVWYTGSCGGTQVSTGLNFNVSPTVTTTYYVRAEGSCSGTSGACASLTIVIEDTVDPVASCPANINVNNDPGLCSAVVSFAATATDNCGGTVDITYSQNPGTVFNVGTTTVNVTATDDTGNTDNCSFDVTVTDNEGPTGTCSDMSLDLAANGQVTFNVFAAGGLTNRADNCGLSGSVGVTGPTLFTCADIGSRSVTIFNRDINGNETPCTVTLTINDPLNVCCTPGVATSIFGSPGPLCPQSTQTLTVNGSLNDDQTWVWYTGSCGGTQVATGANFNVSPTVTTTYYVRAEGSCSGTSGSCASLTIVVDDTVDPVVTCPANINVNNDPGLCSAVVSFAATATDNCGGTVDITYSQNPGTVFNVGTTTVNVTATDDTGNTDNCSFDVTVTDNEGPTGTCNDMTLDLAANGQVTFNVFAAGGLTNRADNCGLSGSVGVTGPTLFTCADIGSRPVTIFNRDINGNETPCTVTLTINDPLGVCNQPPVAECKNISVSADVGQCSTSISPLQVDNGSSDPDGDPLTLTLDNEGPFTVGGPYTVELTVSDGSLTDKCTAMVTVTDGEDPSVACPGDITVDNDPGQCGAVVNYSVTFGDNCPGATLVLNPASGSFFGVGTNSVLATVTDAAGNTAQCGFNVTVNDTEDPIVACPGDITVDNDPGQCGAVVNYSATFGDNCPGATLVLDPASGSFFGVGTNSVLATVTDAAGNTAQCGFNVTVNDTEDPIVACPGDITVDNDPGQCGAVVNYSVTFGDNCPGATLVLNPASGSFFGVGTSSVLATVTDAAGNTAQCGFNVTVNDTEDPIVACPGDITVDNDPGQCGAVVNYSVTFGDNCPGATLVLDPASGSFFGVGTNSVLATVTDAAGNTAQCGFNVTVNDTEDPIVACPGDITVDNDPGQCGAVVNYSVTFGDNCPGATLVLDPASGSFFGVGTNSVLATVTDAAGNTAQCGFNVTVNDTEDPIVACPGDITVDNDPGQCGAVVNYSVTFGDNCPGATLVLDPASGSFFGVGTSSVLATVTDAAGNTAQCGFNVTVNDTEDPIVACPGDITVDNDPGQCGAVVNYSVTFGDNCPGATLVLDPASGSFFGVGTNSVLATVTDAAGNTAQCGFNVTVNDTEDPSFSSCPGNINLFNDPGDCGAIASWTPPTLEDNCPGATADSSHDPGDFFPVGTTTVTYTGTDAAGNDAADCSFTVSVTDIEDPIIACPADISTGTDPGVCGAQVTFIAAIATDNCAVEEVKARYRPVDDDNSALGDWTDRVFDPSGYFPVGRYQVQWRAKDIYGNKRTCSQYLDVYDDEDPIAACKDLTVDFNGEQDIDLTVSQVWDEAASSDNCGVVEFVDADLTIGCEELGNTVAIPVTIRDEAGNTDVCTAHVDVIGLPCGWSEGPNDGSLNCDGQTTSDYDVDEESFTLTSDGCWHDCREEDRATYVYHPLCGDGTLTAKLASINTGGYAGLMARESLDPWARRAGVLKNFSTRRVRREWRASYGGIVSQSQSNRSRVKWLRIVRKGNVIKSYTSTNGSYWRLLYKVTFSNLEDCIYVGMTAYSTNGGSLVNAKFEDVTLTGSGSLAAGLPDQDTVLTPEGLHAWGTVGNVGNGTIEVFPNPASDQAQIVLDGFADQPAKLVVRDAFGKLVQQIDLDSALGVVMPLEVQHLPAGIYMISLIQDDRLVISKKLVVQP